MRVPNWAPVPVLGVLFVCAMWILTCVGCQFKTGNEGELFFRFGTEIALGQRIPGDQKETSTELDLKQNLWDWLAPKKAEVKPELENPPAVPTDADPPA